MTYKIVEGQTVKDGKDGEEILANFWAKIIRETKYVDGKTEARFLTLKGGNKDNNFDDIVIAAEKFNAMSWVTPAWGVRAILAPGQGTRDDMRMAIQVDSMEAERITIYTHTGWSKINGEWTYLHAQGGINKKGNDTKIKVQLPPELSKFILPKVNFDDKLRESVRASLGIMTIALPRIIWPLLAAVYRSAIGPADFAVHISGRTGTYKTEICSLMQSHFGEQMDARNLPGSWSSTPNALEAQAFLLKNAIFVVDDFVPGGTTWQTKALEKAADQLIRAQGNQAGRARLHDTSQLQTTMYPRGIILSSGEEIPTGQSIRARMFIIDIAPNDINVEKLTKLQGQRKAYVHSMAGFVKWLAMSKLTEMQKECREMTNKARDEHIQIGHTRTPTNIGNLLAGVWFFLQYAQLIKAIDQTEKNAILEMATSGIIEAAEMQNEFLETADPVDIFLTTLQGIWTAQAGHCRTRDGGVPEQAELLGYEVKDDHGMPVYKAGGPCVGWVDKQADELFLDTTSAIELIKKKAQGKLSLTKQTIIKRLVDGQKIKRTEIGRGRNTVRINCQAATRTVIVLCLSETINAEGIEND